MKTLTVINNYEKFVKIVMGFNSPTCILAGPGAGKTHLLADIITGLLNKGIKKNKITVLAFGRDASARMKAKLTDPKESWKLADNKIPQIRTMHSLGLEIIKKNPQSVGLLDEDCVTQANDKIKELMFRDAALILDYDEESDAPKAIKCKEHGDCKQNLDKRKCYVCKKYWEIMGKCNYVDFDDHVLLACKVLEQDPSLLKKYQSKAQYLLVDEYQDINAAQFKFIKLLNQQFPNGLLVVGDDAQTIYSFRGARTKFILNFNKMFSAGKTSTLPYSHRCPKEIMKDAFKILNKYYPAYKGITKVKDLAFTVSEGKSPYIGQADTEITEAETCALIARKSLQEEREVLILVPDRRFFQGIMSQLREYGVPYDCDENMLPPRMELLLRFIKWLDDPNNSFLTRLVIEDLINTGIAKVKGQKKLKRYTPETRATRRAEEKRIAELWGSVGKRHNLLSVIKKLKNPDGVLDEIQKWLNSLLELYSIRNTKKASSFSQQLLAVSGAWKKPEEVVDDLSSVRNLLVPQRPTIRRLARLRTLKKAKGLEAHVVIIVGLEKNIVPRQDANLAEQARLFYVSMTRAKENLYLLHSWRRPQYITYESKVTNRPRSPFLDDIGRPSIKFYHPSEVLSQGFSGR